MAEHWGNEEPLGFYPISGVTTLCSPLPCQSIGKTKAPLGSIDFKVVLCSPNYLAEHWGNKGPLGLYFAGSSPHTSWYQLVCLRVTWSPVAHSTVLVKLEWPFWGV